MPSIQPGGACGSTGARLSAAMIVISGTIDRSWSSRIENARSPNGVRSRPADWSIGRTCAVDDSASGSPSATAAAVENPASAATTPASAAPHSTTWSRPKPKMSFLSFHNRDGLSSSPTRNSSKVMPSSATPSLDSASPVRCSTCGPTTAPATRYPSVAPSPKRRNRIAKNNPKPNRITPSRSSVPVTGPAPPRRPPPPPPRTPAGWTDGARCAGAPE